MAAETKTEFDPSCYLPVVVAISLLFLLMELACQPYGNFPLNDDWSYARVVKTLIDSHRLTVTPWTLSASITPVVIGALLCSFLGFSFEILRGLTLAFNLLALLASGYLLKQFKVSPTLMFLGLMTMLVNPLVFCLSNTFMTDVPALSLLLCTCCFYFRYFKSASRGDLFAATILSCAVCLTRQVLILAPASFLLTCLVCNYLSGKMAKMQSASTFLSLLPALSGVLCICLHHLWLLHIGGLPFCYRVEETY